MFFEKSLFDLIDFLDELPKMAKKISYDQKHMQMTNCSIKSIFELKGRFISKNNFATTVFGVSSRNFLLQ